MDFVKTADVNSYIQREALGGIKIPHSTSQPVIRLEDGKYCLAAFVFFYSREDIRLGEAARPQFWVAADICTGELTGENSCKEKEFSDASYRKKYSIRADGVYDTSREYYEKAFALLDEVRETLIDTGTLERQKYDRYLAKITANIPREYQRFYFELSV
ncbi:hypothetical protein [Faecalicatena fissicatena]|uniref:Uncharacterized protein n=1 Tax=Faecalicatena fissicatena TaxID=290055 RepID=A0ABS2E869_9FIRM|nr:hypothetical protein [Faecalicatena fissicatena]MBM6737829.1 hypothetical protein [Faecalicatena fissicatena]